MKSVLEIVEEQAKRDAALEKDRIRKREERAREKMQKQFDSIQSKEDLWTLNRQGITQQELDALQERETFVFALLNDIRTVMENRSPDGEFFSDVAAEIEEDVRQHGVTTLELILLGEFWKTPQYQERFQGNTPDGIFSRLGIITALPNHSLHFWEQFVNATYPATPVATIPRDITKGYVKTVCSSPTCRNAIMGTESVPESIAEGYAKLSKPWFCAACRNLEAKSRSQSTLYGGSK